jgi:phospholipid-transporting ATPase
MMMLRGSSLKNTEWVYGVAVYTGHETKIMKNSARPKAKKS